MFGPAGAIATRITNVSCGVRLGHSAMSARCPVCPKAEMACIGAAGDDAEVGARLFERLRIDVGLGGRLGVILLNAQMSGFGGEAEILCSTRALPVLTRTGPHAGSPLVPRQRLFYMERMRREAALGVCSAGEITNVTQAFQPSGRFWFANSQ